MQAFPGQDELSFWLSMQTESKPYPETYNSAWEEKDLQMLYKEYEALTC